MFNVEDVLTKIKEILKEEIKKKKIFDKDVAQALGINQLTFATMKRRGKLPLNEILDFCAKRKISINWLLYNQATKSLEEKTDKYANVKYYGNIYASAGGGAFNYNENVEEIILDEHMINLLGGKPEIKNIEAINVLGDSMEPTLYNGDIIFINRNLKDISKNGIFVISTPAGIFVKRVFLKSDGSIDLISDNKMYGIETVYSDNIQIIGKVVGVMKNF